MNLLDVLVFWFIFFVVVNGTHQGLLRAALDALVFFAGIVLAALVHPALGKVLSAFFPDMWAHQIAFGGIAGGFALAVTKPFDSLLRHDWRLSKLRPALAGVDRVAGGTIAFALSLLFVHVLALLLLTYPVLRLDETVRESYLVTRIYGRVPKLTGLLPDDFALAENELDQIVRGSGVPASQAGAGIEQPASE
jgi:uncharacterized membrane protein required for colicin V production